MEEPKNLLRKAFAAEEASAAALGEEDLSRHAAIAKRMFHTPVLAVKEMLAPGVADFSKAITDAVNVYRTMYFVSVLKIDMLYVAAILALIGIWVVFIDPLAGILYDRSRTRWGKSRIFLLLGPLPKYLSTMLLYCAGLIFPNDNTADPRKIIYVFLMLLVESTFNALYRPSRDNYLTLMTANPKDRIHTGLVTRYTNFVGSGLVFVFILPIIDLNGRGAINISMAYIFAMLGTVAAVAGTAGSMSLVFGAKERVLLQPRPADTRKALFYLLKNKYALRSYLVSFATAWYGTGGYSWDVVTQMEIQGGVINTSLSHMPYNILNFASVLFVPAALKYFGDDKRKGMLFFDILDIVRCGLQCLCGILLINNRFWFNVVFAIFWGINAADNSPSSVISGEMGREIGDYTEYMTGERPDGTQGLLPGLIMKVMAPLNALFTVAVFRWSGYNPLIPMAPYSQGNFTVYQKVYFLYILGGFLPKLAHLIPLFFYDLVGEKRERMYVALNERRAMVANRQTQQELLGLEAALASGGIDKTTKEEQPA